MDITPDHDPQETREWLDALEGVLATEGPDRAHFLIEQLIDRARRSGAWLPFTANTAYINTIPVERQVRLPGTSSTRSACCCSPSASSPRCDANVMRLDELMRAIPPATQAKLPRDLQDFKVARRSWSVQLYYTDPHVHYEVVTLGIQRAELEIGLHFESRNAAANERLLSGFMQHLFEIKAELGDSFEAEMWDKGWTKVYETIPMESFDEAYVDRVARRLAQVIVVMQPILNEIVPSARE